VTADATDATAQLKLMIGELVFTLANLEAQKAALTQALADAQQRAKPDPTD